jgi:hypothetical protein
VVTIRSASRETEVQIGVAAGGERRDVVLRHVVCQPRDPVTANLYEPGETAELPQQTVAASPAVATSGRWPRSS